MATTDNRKTPVFDWEAGEFSVDLQGGVVTATGAEAVTQIVLKAQQTIRGLFLIYADRDNAQRHHKYGSDVQRTHTKQLPEAARVMELKRAIREALIYDPWVTDVRDIAITKQPVTTDSGQVEYKYVADATIAHVYGTTKIEGVKVANG